MSDVAHNLKALRVRIAAACARAGRDPAEVTLVAVGKTQPVEKLRDAYDAGQRDFAENYAQELRDKARALPNDIRWHFTGHLQKNKVKYVVGTCALVHSVDSPEILEALSARAEREGAVQDILIELNLSREPSKTGASEDALNVLVAEAQALPGVRLRGLMTLAAYDTAEEEIRRVFRKLKRLADSLTLPLRPELSMGMSADFEIAVEEGATLLRVGTAVFGPRFR